MHEKDLDILVLGQQRRSGVLAELLAEVAVVIEILHDRLALGVADEGHLLVAGDDALRNRLGGREQLLDTIVRSEEHTSELQSLMRISYAVFCLKKKIPK